MSQSSRSDPSFTDASVPEHLQRATLRLNFPPVYVVVGAYRLFTDDSLYKPAWDKCRQGVRRGATAGIVWACLSWGIQRRIVRVLLNGPFSFGFVTHVRQAATGLSEERFMGVRLPFSISSYVTFLLVGIQVTTILKFFISHNIRTARRHVWDQTVASRGKGTDFWQPYVEEWDVPPVVKEDFATGMKNRFGLWCVSVFIKRVLLVPLSLYPFVGTFAIAALKAMETSRYLHKPYFKAKKMTPHQIAVFTEEQKWAYRSFGFTAALVEGVPIFGLVFSVSNRIGAAMWAHDLEKHQHYVASVRRARGSQAVKRW